MKACFSYIIPFRQDSSKRREYNLRVILKWLTYFSNLEIIIVEQDEVSHLDTKAFGKNCKHVFIYNPGSFNKSWAINVGFRHSSGQVIAIGDCDLFMDKLALTNSLNQCLNTFDAINPYSDLIDLSKEISDEVSVLDIDASILENHTIDKNREQSGEYLCFSGGIILLKRSLFEKIGGFDERFEGWGGEDDAMDVRIRAFTQNILQTENQTAFHLWHHRNSLRNNNPNYQNNCQILKNYEKLTATEIVTLCKKSKNSIGLENKYLKILMD